MAEQDLIKQVIQKAAADANIDFEQSRKCLKSAFRSIHLITIQYGYFDLSSIGIPDVYSKTRVPIANNESTSLCGGEGSEC